MKVLILCNDFPPINSIGAERPYSWHRYFKKFGAEPVVITKNWISDGSSSFNLVADERSVEETEFGTIIRAAASSTPSTKFYQQFGQKFAFIRRLLTFLEKLLAFVSISFDRHRGIYREARAYLQSNTADVVITTGEPFLLFRHGFLLKKEFGVKWVADYRDGWYLNHVSSLRKGLVHRFIRRYELHFEKKYARQSDLIITVDPELAGRLEALSGKRTAVVYNGFWDYVEDSEPAEKTDKLVLNHAGTLTIGQRVEFLLECVAGLIDAGKLKAEDIEINFIGLDYFPEQVKRVRSYHPALKDVVKTTPRLSKEEASKRNLQASYLINFTDPNLSAIYAKTYNYIACRRPILVIPSDHALLDQVVTENQLGYTFDTQEELAAFLEHPQEADRSERNLDFFRRETQAGILVQHLRELL